MIHKSISRVIFLRAFDMTGDYPVPKTGYASSITVYKVEDSGTPSSIGNPSEVDATNCPGLYRISITFGGDSNAIYAKAADSGIVIEIDGIYANTGAIPSASAGQSGGLPVIGAAPLTNLDASITNIPQSVWAYATRGLTQPVTVGDYSSGKAPDELMNAHGYTTARAIKLDNLDATITSRAPASTALSNTIWTDARAAKLDYLVGSVATQADVQDIAQTVAKLQFQEGTNYVLALAKTVEDKDGYSLTSAYDRAKTALSYTEYVTPDNTSISQIKTQTDKFAFQQIDGTDYVLAVAKTVEDKEGYSLTSAYDRAKTALAYSEYVAPDNTSISQIKAQTDKLAFQQIGDTNYVLALADVDEQAIADAVVEAMQDELIQVIVTPAPATPQHIYTDAGTIVLHTHEKVRASWYLSGVDLRGHNLYMIVYLASNAGKAIKTIPPENFTISYDTEGSLIRVEADDAYMPPPGLYNYVIRDESIDSVILAGTLEVRQAPNVQ